MTTLAQRRRALIASSVILRADVVVEVARLDRGEGRPPLCSWCRTGPAALLLVAEVELTCVHGDDCEVCSASLGESETVVCGHCLTAVGAGDVLAAVDLAGQPGGWGRLLDALSATLRGRLGFDRATVGGVARVTVYAHPGQAPVVLHRPPPPPPAPDGELTADDDVGED